MELQLGGFWKHVGISAMNIKGKEAVHPRTGHEGTIWGMDGQRHAPAALPWERSGTHCIGGWVGPWGRSGRVRKISPPHDSISGPSSP